jgi:hypothetical protein
LYAKIMNKKKVKQKKSKKQKISHWHITSLFVGFFVVGFLIAGIRQEFFVSSSKTFASNDLICPSPVPGSKTLQLGTCYLSSDTPAPIPPVPTPKELISLAPTPFPPPSSVVPLTPAPKSPTSCGIASPLLKQGKDANGNCCVEDGGVTDPTQCCPGVPYCTFHPTTAKGIFDGIGNIGSGGGSSSNSCSCSGNTCTGTGTDPYWCDAKPVIYLYPTEKTLVDVSLKVPGTIPVSDPFYPQEGWNNIVAYPDGTFIYKNKEYKELFYEAAIRPSDRPTNGIIIATDQLRKQLQDMTTKLGLKKTEQEEFIQYWIPRLQDLHSKYVLVSLFSPEQKDKIDHVDITPKPDTFIQFIFYFKPLDTVIAVDPLVLPSALQRKGFTAVEWGGIVDR